MVPIPAYLYYLDMSEFKDAAGAGEREALLLLTDSQGRSSPAAKPGGETESRPNTLDIRGSSWTPDRLYIDLDYIRP